jgi:hypothetical protein
MKSAKIIMSIALLLILASACTIFGKDTPPDPPELYGEEFPTEYEYVVYIIDTSCSMDSQWQTFVDENGNTVSGYRMDRAKSEVIASIIEMDEEYRFDVVAYLSGGVDANFRSLEQATSENKEQAVEWIRALSAKGATETGMGPAVAWAVQHPGYKEAKDYVLVTGGAPVCIEDPEAHLQAQMRMISEANSKGAIVHVALVSPSCKEAYAFGEAVVKESGGKLIVVE